MPATLLVALCLAADTPVSSPLPQGMRIMPSRAPHSALSISTSIG